MKKTHEEEEGGGGINEEEEKEYEQTRPDVSWANSNLWNMNCDPNEGDVNSQYGNCTHKASKVLSVL